MRAGVYEDRGRFLPSGLCGFGGVASIRFNVASARATVSLAENESGSLGGAFGMTIPSVKQFEAFGRIIHYYAEAEFGIKFAMASIIEINVPDLFIIAEPLSSLSLRKVAKSLIKDRFAQTKGRDEFLYIVGDFGTFGPLRNIIAHNLWVKGTRRGSIKPFGLDIRSESAKFIGSDDAEKDWTTKELFAEAGRLRDLHTRLRKYMRRYGLAASMPANAEASSREIDSSDGNSTSDS